MRHRGRPPVDEAETPARVHVTIPSKQYDKAHAIAQREGISVPEVLRRCLSRLPAESDDDEE